LLRTWFSIWLFFPPKNRKFSQIYLTKIQNFPIFFHKNMTKFVETKHTPWVPIIIIIIGYIIGDAEKIERPSQSNNENTQKTRPLPPGTKRKKLNTNSQISRIQETSKLMWSCFFFFSHLYSQVAQSRVSYNPKRSTTWRAQKQSTIRGRLKPPCTIRNALTSKCTQYLQIAVIYIIVNCI